jgi:hypothetical protein
MSSKDFLFDHYSLKTGNATMSSSFPKFTLLPAELRTQIWTCFHNLTPPYMHTFVAFESPMPTLNSMRTQISSTTPHVLHHLIVER